MFAELIDSFRRLCNTADATLQTHSFAICHDSSLDIIKNRKVYGNAAVLISSVPHLHPLLLELHHND